MGDFTISLSYCMPGNIQFLMLYACSSLTENRVKMLSLYFSGLNLDVAVDLHPQSFRTVVLNTTETPLIE